MDKQPEVNFEEFPGYGEDFVIVEVVAVDTENGKTIEEILFLKPTTPVREE